MRAPTALAALLCTLTACSSMEPPTAPAPSTPPPTTASTTREPTHSERTATPRVLPLSSRVPRLRVTQVSAGLDHPWDVAELPDGRYLVTERERSQLTVIDGGHKRAIKLGGGRIWVSDESGLMGLAVPSDFARTHRIHTCEGWRTGSGTDVRVTTWRLDAGLTRATLVKTLLKGFPTSSGRHGGCRLLLTADGALWVGTGDAAVGTNPEDTDSLGGKTLRLDPRTGRPWPSNPWAKSTGRKAYVTSYGHRNVQGLAQRADGTVWNVEHGTFRDDEVNEIVLGGDYGYNPVPGYNEEVPMTDFGLPGRQIAARWRSGDPTVAPSGGTFVPVDERWGAYGGSLAVAVLKDEEMLFISFAAKGQLTRTYAPNVLKRYGRLRSAVRARNGDLLVTTDNGDGRDVLLRVRPS